MRYLKNNLSPALLWAVFHFLFVPWHANALGVLLALRGLLVFFFLLVRADAKKSAPLYQILISLFSTWLPTQLNWNSNSVLFPDGGLTLFIIGSIVVAFSIIDLGKSFGISPAVRPYVTSGIYKYVKNPMYVGHFIGELGVLMVSPTSKNVLLVCAGWSLYFLRARWERRLAESYFEVGERGIDRGQEGVPKWPTSQLEVR